MGDQSFNLKILHWYYMWYQVMLETLCLISTLNICQRKASIDLDIMEGGLDSQISVDGVNVHVRVVTLSETLEGITLICGAGHQSLRRITPIRNGLTLASKGNEVAESNLLSVFQPCITYSFFFCLV